MAASDCKIIECCEPSPFDYNVASGTVYENAQSGFTFDCPEGFVCMPGQYPRTIVIRKGAVQYSPPPWNPNNPFPFPLRMQCCTGWLTEWLPANPTYAQYEAAVQSLLAQWAEAEAGCIEAATRGRSTTYHVGNDVQYVNCPNGDTIANILADIPGCVHVTATGLSLDANVFRERITVSEAASKANVNQKALAFLQGIFDQNILDGGLVCGEYINLAFIEYVNEPHPVIPGLTNIFAHYEITYNGFVPDAWSVEAAVVPPGTVFSVLPVLDVAAPHNNYGVFPDYEVPGAVTDFWLWYDYVGNGGAVRNNTMRVRGRTGMAYTDYSAEVPYVWYFYP